MYSITLSIQSRLVHVQIRYTVLYLCVLCVLLHLAVCLLQCHIVQIFLASFVSIFFKLISSTTKVAEISLKFSSHLQYFFHFAFLFHLYK